MYLADTYEFYRGEKLWFRKMESLFTIVDAVKILDVLYTFATLLTFAEFDPGLEAGSR
jgi:hypothetical protein